MDQSCLLPGWRGRARVLRRALLYWAAAAYPSSRWSPPTTGRRGRHAGNAREAEQASRLALAGRVVVSDLAAARSDLQMLGAIGVVRDYVGNPDPPSKAALARDSPRSWPRGPGADA